MIYIVNSGDNEQCLDLSRVELIRREDETQPNGDTVFLIVFWMASGKELRFAFGDTETRDLEYSSVKNMWEETIEPWGHRSIGQA